MTFKLPFAAIAAALSFVAFAQHGAVAQEPTAGNTLDVRLVGQALVRFDLDERAPDCIAETRSALEGADVAFTNLEVAIRDPAEKQPKLMGAPAVVLDNLKSMGFNLLALSNNHSWDLGSHGTLHTIEEVKKRGFAYAGTGSDLLKAAAPTFLDTPSGRVALVSMASGALQDTARAGPSHAGVNELRFDKARSQLDSEDKERVLAAVRLAATEAPYVIVYYHNHYWGDNRLVTPEWMKAWARELVDAGATIFVAHGVPALHGVEIYKGRPIFYGLGNFIFHTKRIKHYGNDDHAFVSVIAKCIFKDGRLASLRFSPIHLSAGDKPIQETPILGAPRLARGAQAAKILERLSDQSTAFNTRLSIVGDEAEVVLDAAEVQPKSSQFGEPPVISSSWDDLLKGVSTLDDWQQRRQVLRTRYLELIRDQHKPAKPPLDLKVIDTKEVDGIYKRLEITYNVEADERAHAYVGIPLNLKESAPAVVALHGTFAREPYRTAGLVENPDKAYLDHLCRRGYVVIAPGHFVAGKRISPEGPYETDRFYKKHPNWTAVGKFTYEHSIAIDVLESFEEVDRDKIGAMGHSLGGQGTIFLAAYDERIKAAACNCSAPTFRHNPRVTQWARDRWYVYLKHIRPDLLKGDLPPIDFHEIISLVAPRAFLDVYALNDGNPLVQRQRVLMSLKIADVYELLGKPEHYSFYVHGRGHSVPYQSRELIYGFLDAHLKPESAIQSHLVDQ